MKRFMLHSKLGDGLAPDNIGEKVILGDWTEGATTRGSKEARKISEISPNNSMINVESDGKYLSISKNRCKGSHNHRKGRMKIRKSADVKE